MSYHGAHRNRTPEDDAKILRAWRQITNGGSRYGANKALAERFRCSPALITVAVQRAQAREKGEVAT